MLSGNLAHERIWKTDGGKAEFTTPTTLDAAGLEHRAGGFPLMTLRSNDQFNATVYGLSDRLSGFEGDRMVVLMSPDDIAAAGLEAGRRVSLVTDLDDGRTQCAICALAARPTFRPAGEEGDPGARRAVTSLAARA